MIEKFAPCHVAVIDSLDVQRIRLRDRLVHSGCTPVLFADVSELLTLLSQGTRFDLLLAVEGGNAVWGQLSAVCGVIGMPVLLLVQESGVDRATAWLDDFPAPSLFDFASVDSHDDLLRRRMASLLYRAREHRGRLAEPPEAAFDGYVFHEGVHCVVHKNREIFLQPRQFQLALALFRNIGRVVERQTLWATLWGGRSPPHGARAIDVCVASVRRKLHLHPENGFTLNAVYGRGYQLHALASAASPILKLRPSARGHAETVATSLSPRPAKHPSGLL